MMFYVLSFLFFFLTLPLLSHLFSSPLFSSFRLLFLCLWIRVVMCVCVCAHPVVDVNVYDRLIIGLTVGHATYLETDLLCLWGTHTHISYYSLSQSRSSTEKSHHLQWQIKHTHTCTVLLLLGDICDVSGSPKMIPHVLQALYTPFAMKKVYF